MNARLDLLASTEAGITESDVFRLALQHAVAELGGLGGVIHLGRSGSALFLVSSSGLPPGLTRLWELIERTDRTFPRAALRPGRSVWVPTAAADAPAPPPERWPGTGFAALPLTDEGRTLGALTVVTGDEGEPTAEQWAFLRDVADWTVERMGQAPLPAPPPRDELVGGRLRQALKEVEVGTWNWDPHTGELVWDEAGAALFGTELVTREDAWMKALHPDDLPSALTAMERAMREGTVYDAEYRVRLPDGGYRWVHGRGAAEYDGSGEPVRMMGMVWDCTESRTARDTLSRALRHMSDGFLLVDGDWRIGFANLEAERTLGAPEAELFGRVLWELPAVHGIPDLESRCRKAATAATALEFDVEIATGRSHHLRLVPSSDGLALYFTDVTEQRRRGAERAAAESAAAERSARIAELTAALATATTSRDVVDAVAERVLPPFGATGLIVVAVEDDRSEIVGAVGYPPTFVDEIDGQKLPASDPIRDVARSEAPLFIASAEEFIRRYPGLAYRPRVAGKEAWAFLPLTVSGRTRSVCLISFDRPRRLAHDEQTLLTAISALFAHALERARLYDAEHTRSQGLQRDLLPRRLPEIPACTAAARYLPAGQGMEVGGDWYDVIPLSAGRVALVVGDVMGHGLAEAATMGRLRTAVNTLADLELPPEEILSRLNDLVGELGGDFYATCLYALYDSTTRTCTIAGAGHPPPAVVLPDGTVHFPELPSDPPLGAAEPPFGTVELAVPDGSLLVLYTDGLVETPGREIDEGMAELARLLRGADHGDLERLCDTLTTGLLPDGQLPTRDDAALLVCRVHALAADRIASWELDLDPRAAGQARRHIREQLAVWGLDDLAPTTELIVSELIGNVVRYARGPVHLRLLESAGLTCEVYDGSLATPRIRHAAETDEGGRGLQLVAALSQRWGARYTTAGKCIWTEQALSADPDDPDALAAALLAAPPL
ncbi:SpoIIE family protein phosphatase [Streptomyces sp. NPDC048604]|uniref:SpoIIE family protein phosphatase n=1 Tax=Streptomyces sp. NPDC048604 TaxID=3365578 RepID=UPI00371F1F91